VSQYQKGKTNLDFSEARYSEWQWNWLGHMQVCTSLKTDNHASTSPLSCYRQDALPAAQTTACCPKGFDTVDWVSGRASGLQKLSDEVLVWLSVCSEVQIVFTWSS